MKRIVLLIPLLFAACSDSPTAPTRIDSTFSAQRQLDPTRSVFTFGPSLGAASVTNTTATADTFTFIVWKADDAVNQIDVAHDTVTLAPGASFTFGVGLSVAPCSSYQPDIYKGLQKAERYTMSDVGNYLYAGGPLVGPRSHCRNPPDPPKECIGCTPTTTCVICPIDPVCSADSFSALEGHIDDITIVVHATVKPSYDGIVFYLTPYGVPAFRRGDGDLPLPQTAGSVTRQVLHVGENVITAPLVSPALFAGWQWEGGCTRGPDPLTEENYRAFTYLVSGWGNFR